MTNIPMILLLAALWLMGIVFNAAVWYSAFRNADTLGWKIFEIGIGVVLILVIVGCTIGMIQSIGLIQ